MTRAGILAAAITASLAAGAANAATTTIFFEDFAEELTSIAPANQANNFAALDSFSIVSGTVDLFGNGGFGLSCPSAGCLDLDGSTGAAASLLSPTLMLTGGNFYEFSFVLGGSQRGSASDTLTLRFDTDLTYSFAPADGFQTITYGVDLGGSATVPFSFELIHSGGDNIGIILDSVTVTETPTNGVAPVPLPGAMALLLAGLGGLAVMRRRKG